MGRHQEAFAFSQSAGATITFSSYVCVLSPSFVGIARLHCLLPAPVVGVFLNFAFA